MLIVHKWVTKQTAYFYNNGQRASGTQFPLQNSFFPAIHKTQGITLPCVSLALDSSIFSADQAYIALSRYPKWEHVQIMSLHRDPINEYQCLEDSQHPSIHLHTRLQLNTAITSSIIIKL